MKRIGKLVKLIGVVLAFIVSSFGLMIILGLILPAVLEYKRNLAINYNQEAEKLYQQLKQAN